MLFNSVPFMIFFPVVTLLFYGIPKRWRYLWLLGASYYFYMSWNPRYAVLIGISTAITWLSGILLGTTPPENTVRRKWIVAGSFLTNLGILGFFKYANFTLGNVAALCGALGITFQQPKLDILLPVGISFYTFQALGYTVDVYRGEIEPEKNICRYALFVSFFPQLVAGPIERSENLLRQIRELPTRNNPDYRTVINGLVLMLWGFFMKMVIADRIAVLVNTVFGAYTLYGTFELFCGAFAFAIQIYCDFASYSTIAIGAAQVLGFTLMENFDTPYFSRNMQEFWSRWHISLSTWLQDYLFEPFVWHFKNPAKAADLGLLVVFLTSGLWHGASWTFVMWGLLHGIYRVVGNQTRKKRRKLYKRLHVKTESESWKLGQVTITFLLTDFAYIFFRADTVGDAFGYIARLFTKWNPWALFNGALYNLGLSRQEMNILLCAVVALLIVDLIRYFKKQRMDLFLEKQCVWFRWGVLLALIGAIVLFGEYGPAFDPQQFIYFQF